MVTDRTQTRTSSNHLTVIKDMLEVRWNTTLICNFFIVSTQYNLWPLRSNPWLTLADLLTTPPLQSPGNMMMYDLEKERALNYLSLPVPYLGNKSTATSLSLDMNILIGQSKVASIELIFKVRIPCQPSMTITEINTIEKSLISPLTHDNLRVQTRSLSTRTQSTCQETWSNWGYVCLFLRLRYVELHYPLGYQTTQISSGY